MKGLVVSREAPEFAGTSLVDLPVGKPGAGEVLVRVQAASLNFPDLLMTEGKYQFRPEPPFVLGMELSGVVEAVGEGVERLKPGDEVVGGSRTGAFAGYIIMAAASLRPKPENFSFAQAAAFGAAYLTAYVALVCRGQLKAGETLLVHGASGGVGLAAVDLGKLLGARVIATSACDRKLEIVRQRGADQTIRISGGFRDQVRELTGGRGADVIFDPVGGDVFDESTRCIAFDGRLLVIGFASGRIPAVSVNMALIKGFSIVGVRAGEYGRRFPERGLENLDNIWRLAGEGRLVPHIHAQMPLSDWRRAFDCMRSRQVVGKLVLTP